MCYTAVEKDPRMMRHVPDHLETQKMCDKVVRKGSFTLQYVPDWFVTQQQLRTWNSYCNDDTLIKWYDSYKKRKAQKAQIKKELMPTAWHTSRWWDWCVPQYEKKETEKLWA